ncbi:MAG: AraC family transcriptional regulator [Phycisphaerae bacterium]|nr:AraC family transcriptional regulator [Phycisphaerae bacterium]
MSRLSVPQTVSDQDAGSLRRRFLEAIDPARHFHLLLNHLPSVLFFAKDLEGRLLAANTALLRHYGFDRDEPFYGRTDFDLLPRSMAEKFRRDDLRVIESAQPMLEIVEIFVDRRGVPDWFLTNKLPVFSRAGEVIGVMGTIEAYESHRAVLPAKFDLTPAMMHIQEHFTKEVSVGSLARMCGLSIRQFERKFKQHFKTTPQQFIVKMRVFSVCDALRQTNEAIGELATKSGFYDQSSFTRQFRKHLGITPLQYRKRYR